MAADKTYRVRLTNGLHFSHPFAEGQAFAISVPPGGVAIIDEATMAGLKRKGKKVQYETVGDDVPLSTFAVKSGGVEHEVEFDIPALNAAERQARIDAGQQVSIKNAGMRGAIAEHFKAKAKQAEKAAADAGAKP